MISFRKPLQRAMRSWHWKYQPLAFDEQEHNEKAEEAQSSIPRRAYIFYVIPAVLLVAIVIVFWQILFENLTSNCRNPLQRQEWRELSTTDKSEYISAVLCLMDRDSLFTPGSSRYDDFAYTHVFEGTVTHYAAAFLPWHRYFIHIYEKALVEDCQYSGALPYWDWGLDAHDLSASPIFDTTIGFGGNGRAESPEHGVFKGSCVTEGPFMNTTRHWQSKSNGHGFDILQKSHCLSRGFQSGQQKVKLESRITVAAIETVLSTPTYEAFVDALEIQAHNSIPQFIRGDFHGLTAPNDPIFYLHHAQVDRLWWLWQQQNPESRTYAYQGPGENVRVYHNSSHTKSALEDVISLGNLSEPVWVQDLMTTESHVLCYRY